MTIKAIFFDIDGVLVHGYHHNKKFQHPWDLNIEEDLGLDKERFTKEYVFGSFSNEVIYGKRNMHDTLTEYLPQLGYTGSIEKVIQYWLENDSKVNEELFSHIQTLKDSGKYRLFVATNQAHERADYLWNEKGFKDYFEKIYYSANLGVTKHSREYFEIINKELGLKDGEALFFDDSPAYLVEAEKAGWNTAKYDVLEDFKNHPVIKKALLED